MNNMPTKNIRIPMRIELSHGTHIVCGYIFPVELIQTGQTWQGSSGSRVQITGTRTTEAGDTWVQYMQANGVPHEKLSGAFQSRYCMDIGESKTLPDELLEHISRWDACHIGYTYKENGFLYQFNQFPAGVEVNRYKIGPSNWAAPSTVEALNCDLEFTSMLRIGMMTRMIFSNMGTAIETVAGLNSDMMMTIAKHHLFWKGWTPLSSDKSSAICSKDYSTAVGVKTAFAYLSAGDEHNRTLSADYQSEGRNVVEGDSILLPSNADVKEAIALTRKFAAGVEKTIQQTPAMKPMHNHFPPAEDDGVVQAIDAPSGA